MNGLLNETHKSLATSPFSELKDFEESNALVMGMGRQLHVELGKFGSTPPPTQQDIHNEILMLLIAKLERLRVVLWEAYLERSNGGWPLTHDILIKSILYMDAATEEFPASGKHIDTSS
ncbi:hypothetical protein F5Y19DRAFT_480102 [Xylariaceae sp. FL1651]|nr:hypothetical protein F5Y19DRAFT_480102 [Xylariaceae sp. FL1651]